MDLWRELTVAICLVFILEGIMPFLMPRQWQAWMQQVCSADERTVRISGLASMLLGLVLLYMFN